MELLQLVWATDPTVALFSEKAARSPQHLQREKIQLNVLHASKHQPIRGTHADARDNEGFFAVPSQTPSWKVGVMSEWELFRRLTKLECSFLGADSASATFKYDQKTEQTSEENNRTQNAQPNLTAQITPEPTSGNAAADDTFSSSTWSLK